MKLVALVVPNFRWVDSDKNALWHYLPYNLCLLASCIKDIANVFIIDAYKYDMTVSEVRDKIRETKPDLVGATVLMDKYALSGHMVMEIAKGLRCDTVLGGVYATVNAEEAVKDDNTDFVVVGEGEFALRRLVLGGTPKGVVYGDRVLDLDALPLPSYDLIDYSAYTSKVERVSVDNPPTFPYGRVITSRGCPFRCCFCQVEKISGREFRGRSAQNVIAEIKWLKYKYGIQSLVFDDDNMLNDQKRAEDIFKGMCEEGLQMPWVMIATAAFKLNSQLVQLMRLSGCIYVDIAVESGTERVLYKIIGKPVKLSEVKGIVEMLRLNGIYVAVNFIIGFPTETWDEIRQTIKFAEEVNADYVKLFMATPLRKTKLWTMCEEKGAFKESFDGTSQWHTGQIETSEFTVENVSTLRKYEWDRINFTDEERRKRTCNRMGITEKELMKIRKNTLRGGER